MVNIVYAGGRFGEPNTWRWSKEKLEWGLKNNFIVFDEHRKKTNGKIVQFDVVGGSYGPIPDDFHPPKKDSIGGNVIQCMTCGLCRPWF